VIRLILVRHGNTFENHQTPKIVGARSDLPLTAQGCEQARQLARYLISKGMSPAGIYAGGLKRQIQTAQIINELLSIEQPVEELLLKRRRFFTPLKDAVRLKPHTAFHKIACLDPPLKGRDCGKQCVQSHETALTEIDYGPWEGLTQEEVFIQWPHEYNDWTTESRWAQGIFGKTLDSHLCDIKNWILHLRTSYAPGDAIVGVTSNGVMRFFYSLLEMDWQHCVKERQMEQLKVKTGHFCELHILKDSIKIISWNVKPVLGNRT